MPTWPTLLAFIERDGVAVLVTVAEAKGSTPREQGARMAVRADGAFSGTIGGGTLEWLALAEAQKLARGGPPSTSLDKALGPDLGQCCGGRAVLSLERFTAEDRAWIAPLAAAETEGPIETLAERDPRGVLVRRLVVEADRERIAFPRPERGIWHERFGDVLTPVLLFGAGHVGRALALALAPLPFRVTWIDDRKDAFPAHVPANVTCLAAADPAAVLSAAPAGSLVAVMTHSHALDLAVVAAALPDGRFPYVGLIGSRTKRARFARQLADAGQPPEMVGRLVCPIGLTGIAGKEPAVIAAGITAQLLLERERLAALRDSGDRPDAPLPREKRVGSKGRPA